MMVFCAWAVWAVLVAVALIVGIKTKIWGAQERERAAQSEGAFA